MVWAAPATCAVPSTGSPVTPFAVGALDPQHAHAGVPESSLATCVAPVALATPDAALALERAWANWKAPKNATPTIAMSTTDRVTFRFFMFESLIAVSPSRGVC
jgi:hypothetical protein